MQIINNSRNRHVIAGIHGHFDDCGALDVHFSTGGGVSTGHSTGLVESMRLHTTCVITYKHLQDDRILHTLQLWELVKRTAADEYKTPETQKLLTNRTTRF